MKNVTIYSTPTCAYCSMAKKFFETNTIKYTEHNVAADAEKRNEMIQKTGQLGVPVIIVDNDIIIGFDENRLREIFNI